MGQETEIPILANLHSLFIPASGDEHRMLLPLLLRLPLSLFSTLPFSFITG